MPAQEATGSCGGLRTFRKRRISVDIDPKRHFGTANCSIAKSLGTRRALPSLAEREPEPEPERLNMA